MSSTSAKGLTKLHAIASGFFKCSPAAEAFVGSDCGAGRIICTDCHGVSSFEASLSLYPELMSSSCAGAFSANGKPEELRLTPFQGWPTKQSQALPNQDARMKVLQ